MVSPLVAGSLNQMAGMVLILRGVNNDSFMANNYMFNFFTNSSKYSSK